MSSEQRPRTGRGSGRKSNFPTATRPVEKSNDVSYAKELFMLPTIDMGDPEAVRDRYFELLELSEKYGRAITIEALSMGFDTTREEIIEVSKGEKCRLGARLSSESLPIFQKCLNSVAGIWATHMSSGDFKQPVAGIFIGKNNFGYGDVTETVIRHESGQQGPSRAELEAKYQSALPSETPIDADVEAVYELPKPKKATAKRKTSRARKTKASGRGGKASS
jgi:hypothetical protein